MNDVSRPLKIEWDLTGWMNPSMYSNKYEWKMINEPKTERVCGWQGWCCRKLSNFLRVPSLTLGDFSITGNERVALTD